MILYLNEKKEKKETTEMLKFLGVFCTIIFQQFSYGQT